MISFSRMIRYIFMVALLACTLPSAVVAKGYRVPYPKKWKRSYCTMYSDSIGAAGVYLNRYPIKARVGDAFGTRRLYPIAVYSSDVRAYKYDVLEIRHGSRRIFGHVVDECASGDCHSNNWIAEKKGRLLLDIHKTAFQALRMPNWDTYTMCARVVGRVRPVGQGKKMLRRVLTPDGKKGYIPTKWSVRQ